MRHSSAPRPTASKSIGLLRLFIAGVLAAGTLTMSAPAEAKSGIYAQIGLGFGSFSGSALRVYEGAANEPVLGDGCCPGGGLAFDLHLGFSLFHLVAPEFVFLGDIFGMGAAGGVGGGGMIGGGLRLFPLGIFEIAGMPLDIPIDLSLGFDMGYTVVGKDFAYTGSWLGFDGALEYHFTDVFGLGARFQYVLPSYSDFVFTDYNGNLGRCLDSSSNFEGPVISADTASCSGSGPSSSYISPSVYAAFNIDLF